MRTVCCCDGEGAGALVERLLARLPGVTMLVLLHCIDSGPEQDVHMIQERLLHHHPPERHTAEMTATQEARAVAILEEAARAALASGYRGELQTRTLHGRPEHELVRALEELGADMVGLFPRPPSRQQHPGPHSLGHVARYIVDHAPCDVLLLRGDAA